MKNQSRAPTWAALGRVWMVIVVLFAAGIHQTAAATVYQFGVVPQLTAVDVHRQWTPVVEAVSEASGLHIQLKLFDTIPAFEAAFMHGDLDFAYMNPYHAVMARQRQGYEPLVRDSLNKLMGILVVRKDSPYQTVQDLNGRVISFPSPNAFAASLYMRALLEQRERVTFRARYDETHSNAFRQVLLGRSDAAGVVVWTFEAERPEVREHLRVIYRTPSHVSHPIAAHPRVSAAERAAFVEAFLHLKDTEQGRQALDGIAMAAPIAAVYSRDYQPLESLNLERYLHVPEPQPGGP